MIILDSEWQGPAWLRAVAAPVLTRAGLPLWTLYIQFTVLACLSSFLLQNVSHIVSPRLFPRFYPTNASKQRDWDLHVVGWAFSLIAAPMAISTLIHPSAAFSLDRIYGIGVREARLAAFSIGYFIWDAYVSAVNVKTQGVGFLLHGLGSCVAFIFTLTPFLLYCTPQFLVWEVSTVFLNMHWFLDKFNMTGSLAQMVNGAFLVLSYISVRLIFGTYNSFQFFKLMFLDPRGKVVPLPLKLLYVSINITMNCLNFFWFRAMLLALKKRFVNSDPEARKQAIQVDGKLNWSREEKKKVN